MKQQLKRELYSLLPPFLFFLFAFNWINWIDELMVRKEGLEGFSSVAIFIASAVVAKVLLLFDHVSWINLFAKRPLIYSVFWKTACYGTWTLLVRLLDRLLPHLLRAADLNTGYQAFLDSVHWEVFWAVQIWYFTIFFIFVLLKELVRAIGFKKSWSLFFGRKSRS